MNASDKSALLALVSRRGIVRLDFLCSTLFNKPVEEMKAAELDGIHATLLEAGWIQSIRASDGVLPMDVYERPMQDLPRTAATTAPAVPRPLTASAILRSAAQAIQDRAAARDMQAERSMGRTVAAFNALTGHTLSEREGWLFMVALKAARATAGAHHDDDYTDGAAYFALAGECAAKSPARPQPTGATTRE
jgi:hypothetical protein